MIRSLSIGRYALRISKRRRGGTGAPTCQNRRLNFRARTSSTSGNGNLHNSVAPCSVPPEELSTITVRLSRIVHDIVSAINGSVSAEHGVGQLRRPASWTCGLGRVARHTPAACAMVEQRRPARACVRTYQP